MGEEHKVDVESAVGYRKPARDVWTTTTKVRKLDPLTGRARSVKIAIVRWRRADGRVAERRFDDPVLADAFAKQRREELRTGSVRARGGTVPFSEWMDTCLSARCAEYVQWKRREIKSLDGSDYAGLMKVAGDAFLRLRTPPAEDVGSRPADLRRHDVHRVALPPNARRDPPDDLDRRHAREQPGLRVPEARKLGVLRQRLVRTPNPTAETPPTIVASRANLTQVARRGACPRPPSSRRVEISPSSDTAARGWRV